MIICFTNDFDTPKPVEHVAESNEANIPILDKQLQKQWDKLQEITDVLGTIKEEAEGDGANSAEVLVAKNGN